MPATAPAIRVDQMFRDPNLHQGHWFFLARLQGTLAEGEKAVTDFVARRRPEDMDTWWTKAIIPVTWRCECPNATRTSTAMAQLACERLHATTRSPSGMPEAPPEPG